SSVSNMRLMEEVKKQESGFYPSVDAFLEKTKSIEPRATSSESNRIGVRLNQNLFAGFRDKYSSESASFKQQANQFQGKYDSAKLRFELKNLFDASLFYQKAIVFAEKTVARRAENLRIVNLRYEGGRENRSSVLKTEASLLMAEVDLKDYVSSLELTKNNLAKLTGLMLSDLNKIEGSLANRQDPSQFSLQDHPLVQQSNFMKQSTGVDVGIARSQWLPKVDAAADFYRRGADQKIDSQNYLTVSLNLSVPLFEPAQSHNYKIAVFSATDAELNAAKVENDIEIELRTSESEFQSAQLSLTAAAKSLEASKLQAEVYRQRYTLGMISFQDWDAAETDFIKSEKDLLGAEHQLSKSISKVNLARGLTIEES
ncbi:MAG: TolC family protein, partial [Proteobacteria bacterium]|nr:TolC family protein [Pseudomonadota bacterium]